MTNQRITELEDAVVKFVGDSGDGMQLIGTFFSDTAALLGNDLATFPDYPAEIRAPHNTIPGVSGFQTHIGKRRIHTPGDQCHVLVAMNPASLKSNLKWCKSNATIIVDSDIFDEKGCDKAGYSSNPLTDGSLDSYKIHSLPISTITREFIEGKVGDLKSGMRSRNMVMLGIVYNLFGIKLDIPNHLIEKKFGKKPALAELNKEAVKLGYDYANEHAIFDEIFHVGPAELEKGTYRNVTGNVATAWGLLAAAEKSGRPFFLGSYPITPATEILMELALHKSLGAKVFQAEDEIAGICSAIGASFTGAMACTTTSGPGLSLKSEAIGLAVMTELPLVIVNVQRAGPSTGMPTKSEQSDLYQALYGRNGECPVMIIAASTPANCFYYAYMASKYSLEHMTPVILLTDGYLGFGAQIFKVPKMAELPAINPPIAEPNEPDFKPYKRDKNLVRRWAIPGTDGLRHRIGGLEKLDVEGTVSTDPYNHQKMSELRLEKVMKMADFIPEQDVYGDESGDLLVVSWGGTEGAIRSSVKRMIADGKKVSHAHFNYIMPLPKNTADIFKKFKKIIVCELNMGQFVNYLRSSLPEYKYEQFNKIQGLPFLVAELKEKYNQILEEL